MRQRSRKNLEHGPRRLLLRPWRRVCRCGFGRWPCYPWEMLCHQSAQARGRAPVYPVRRSGPPAAGATAPLLTRGQAARSRQAGRW
jgi:hypothetical protein